MLSDGNAKRHYQVQSPEEKEAAKKADAESKLKEFDRLFSVLRDYYACLETLTAEKKAEEKSAHDKVLRKGRYAQGKTVDILTENGAPRNIGKLIQSKSCRLRKLNCRKRHTRHSWKFKKRYTTFGSCNSNLKLPNRPA